MHLRRLLIAVSVPALLTLTACGQGESTAYAGGPASPGASSEQGGESPDPEKPEESSDPSDGAIPDLGDTGDSGGDATPPGTQLKFGDTATVGVTSLTDPEATLDYTVNGVDTPSEQANSYATTARIDITVTATRDVENLLVLPMFEWEVATASGDTSTLGAHDGCEAELPDSMRAGESVDICVAVTLDQGATPTEVHHSNSSDGTGTDPIVWTR